jgi:hypothetical protein
VKVKLEVDGELKYEDPRFDDLSELEVGVDCHKYDLEEYHLPPVLRRVLKTSKQGEVFQIRTSRRGKLLPAFSDPAGIFTREVLEAFTKEVTLTICLIAFEQKDYLFKSLIIDKQARLIFLKGQATAFFKAGNLRKALKLYLKVHSYFRTKDARNNFQKEDETTEIYQ